MDRISNLLQRVYIFSFLVLTAPHLALAQGTDPEEVGTILDLIGRLAAIVNPLIAILTGFAILAFVRGVAVFIWQADNEEKRAEGKKFMVWGIIGMFVLVAFWGIVRIILVFYFGTAVGTPYEPPL